VDQEQECRRPAAPGGDSPVRQVSIAHSEVHAIAAANIPGQIYQLRVCLPERYGETVGATYPVLYVLDGDHCFGMATDVVRLLQYGHDIPEVILVAVAYDSLRTPAEGGTNMRVRDLTPFPAAHRPGSGGAQEFWRFLREQVFPFVESTYRVTPSDRALWGHSLGGLFGLYVLFTSPGMFRRYIITSPALRYGDRDAFDLEAQFARTHREGQSPERASGVEGMRTAPALLYLAAAELDYYYPPFHAFVRTLDARRYTHLSLRAEVLAGATHFSAVAEAFAKGVKAVFGRPSTFERLLRATQERGIESAIGLYREVRRQEPGGHNVHESELNTLGLYLLANQQPREAMAVFEENLIAYPDSLKAREGLAQAHRAIGGPATVDRSDPGSGGSAPPAG